MKFEYNQSTETLNLRLDTLLENGGLEEMHRFCKKWLNKHGPEHSSWHSIVRQCISLKNKRRMRARFNHRRMHVGYH